MTQSKDSKPAADYRSRIASADPTASTLKAQLDLLPTTQEWQAHLEDDLLPFWLSPAALGTPIGNFPSFRANDGSVIDPANPPPEFKAIPDSEEWIKPRVGRQYARMVGRQVYAYCVAFHITGKEEYLAHAKAGMDYMLGHMLDENGILYCWMENGKGYPENPLHRISQDMTYAILGPATYYYLTHDAKAESFIVRMQKYIFETYPFPNIGELRWVAENCSDLAENYTTEQRELVAQLDQINAYMLLATPALPSPVKEKWTRDMVMLSRSIKNNYWSKENHFFWGRVDDEQFKKIGQDHVDFGHTIKTLWMLYLVGKNFGENDLAEFAEAEVPVVMAEAFHPLLGTWVEKKKPLGELGTDRIWWVHAELDQVAATFSMGRPDYYTKYLAATYPFWFNHLVDQQDKEVWHGLIGKPPGVPIVLKAHLWKNAFHSFEHALVGYMSSAVLSGQPVPLYFAFAADPEPSRLQPYIMPGSLQKLEKEQPLSMEGLTRYKASFTMAP